MTPQTQTRFTAARVRRDFLDFFAQREHREVPSGPVFPQDDPTLLFTNAGMNQFKDVFVGTGKRDYARAVDSQKCIRVSGKHNDLEEVGRDTYHHTFFEMLGNWSFGDYFKEDAIRWAWELLTGVWGLPKDKLWVTVFAGDEKDGLPADEEAERIWREATDIDPARVLRFDKRDNFWEMGETGPCGPCSEIHIDRGGPGSNPADGADPRIGVNAGNERFIELWNLVFMQFNRQDDRSLVELPAKSVDTGMGFERILSVLQGHSSNYDTDLFQPLFARIGSLTGRSYGAGDEEADVAFRVIADHLRAVSCAFADGALPSNEGRGYVLRRLIRRAARFGRQALGKEEPFLHGVVPTVAEVLGDAFPEIRQREDHITLLVDSEEKSFAKTLDRGLVLFDQLAGRIGSASAKVIPGGEAYELYATYGFPRDLVELMAREQGLEVDEDGWNRAQAAHREVSKSEGKFKQLLSADDLKAIEDKARDLPALGWQGSTESTYHAADPGAPEGPETREVETYLVHLKTGDADGRGTIAVLARSPFYPESGGQVGDTGQLLGKDGQVLMDVEDTQNAAGLVAHIGRWQRTAPVPGPGVAHEVVARVDESRRRAIRANHTATHLLHKALRDVLGEHVTQQGSYVGPDRLRFDLSHPRAVTREELEEIERRVNDHVALNHSLATTIENPEEAKARGVTALFGEKYGERVRVVDAGAGSVELCGGTHVRASGDIGPFVVLSERAIQAGVRRIEALTQAAALRHVQEQRRVLQEASQTLKTSPEELGERIVALQKQVKEAKKKEKQSAGDDVRKVFEEVKASLTERGGVAAGVLDLPACDSKTLRELGDRVKSLSDDLFVAVFGRDGERVPFLVVCQGAALAKGLAAGALAKELSEHVGGGGGGRPEQAQGQGLRAAGVPAAIEALQTRLAAVLDG